MGIKDLANANRLRYRLDGCLDPIIQGKFGHLYEHSPSQLGVCLEHPVNSKVGICTMRRRMRQLDALGLQNRQKAESEGTWLLPLDSDAERALVAQVLKIAGIRKIRKATGRPFQKVVQACT